MQELAGGGAGLERSFPSGGRDVNHSVVPGTSPLEQILSDYPSVLVGYSGGVDSALVAVVARRVLGKDRALAALGVSASLPRVQHEQALEVARSFDLDLIEIATDELGDPNYVANSPDRCYYCKSELWSKLVALARERGVAIVADGTNLDDLGEHRPGLRARNRWGVRSPLVDAGYTKERVREEARRLGIPIWNAPAAPCLSSRIMYGLSVTGERLRQVERGEELLRSLGVKGDLRVRHRGPEARIEVAPSEFAVVRRNAGIIGKALLELGFETVTLDLRGYRRGSLLAGESAELELLAQRG